MYSEHSSDSSSFSRSSSDFNSINHRHHDSTGDTNSSTFQNPYLPTYLSRAVNSLSVDSPHFCTGKANLPSPGLRVRDGDSLHSLSLPLVDSDKVLLASIADTLPGDPMIIDTDVISCANPEWSAAVNALVDKAMTRMNIPTHLVHVQLAHLWLQQKLNISSSHAHHGHTFATFVVQLPSTIEGGELCFNRGGHQTVFELGADTGAAEFDPHYVAFLSDVCIDWAAPTTGCRLALVYHLSWKGVGMAPDSSWTPMDQVVEALKRYAHDEGGPTCAWKVAFCLTEQYNQAARETPLLKGEDGNVVSALRRASDRAGFGKLEVVVCCLEWERGARNHNGRHTVQVAEAFGEDGRMWTQDLGFIQWGNVVIEETLVEEHHGMGMSREEAVFAVALWPKNKNLEVFYTPNATLDAILFEVDSDDMDEALGRLLGCMEFAGPRRASAWSQTKDMLDYCTRHNFAHHAYRALRFASNQHETPGMDECLLRLLTAIGPINLASIVGEYLCPIPSRFPKAIVHRLESMYALRHIISTDVCRRGLAAIEKHVETRQGMRNVKLDSNESKYAHRRRLDHWWTMFLRILVAHEDDFSTRDMWHPNAWANRMAEIVRYLQPMECDAMYKAFLTVQSFGSMRELFRTLEASREAMNYPLFFALVNKFVKFEHPRCEHDSSFEIINCSWSNCLDLLITGLSAAQTRQMWSKIFGKFLNAILNMTSSQLRQMAEGACKLSQKRRSRVPSEVVPKAKLDLQHLFLGKILLAARDNLRALIDEEPAEVQKSFPEFRCGDKDIDAFMASDTLQYSIDVKNVAKGNAMVARIGSLFPANTIIEVKEFGSRPNIVITKGALEAEQMWTEYRKNRKVLEAVEGALAWVEGEIGTAETWDTNDSDGKSFGESLSDDSTGTRASKRRRTGV